MVVTRELQVIIKVLSFVGNPVLQIYTDNKAMFMKYIYKLYEYMHPNESLGINLSNTAVGFKTTYPLGILIQAEEKGKRKI